MSSNLLWFIIGIVVGIASLWISILLAEKHGMLEQFEYLNEKRKKTRKKV